jgi:hypothetical protein
MEEIFDLEYSSADDERDEIDNEIINEEIENMNLEIVSKFTMYVRELKNDGHDDHATGGPSTKFPCRTYGRT